MASGDGDGGLDADSSLAAVVEGDGGELWLAGTMGYGRPEATLSKTDLASGRDCGGLLPVGTVGTRQRRAVASGD